MMSLSEAMLSLFASEWAALTEHRFFRAAAEGTLRKEARDAYLLNERAFVDQAVTVFAHVLSGAPNLAARRHLVSVLRGLVDDQPKLFDTVLTRLGLPTGVPDRDDLPTAARALCDGMTAIARDGDYAQGLAAMFVAERSYREVSPRIASSGSADPELRAWFALHTEEGFTRGVDWLTAELDALGQRGLAVEDIAGSVARAISLEMEFHAAPLDLR